MYEAQRSYLDDKGSRMFLFTSHTAFAAGDPFADVWRNGRGERQALLRLPPEHDGDLRQTR